jgi:hypothetical protein
MTFHIHFTRHCYSCPQVYQQPSANMAGESFASASTTLSTLSTLSALSTLNPGAMPIAISGKSSEPPTCPQNNLMLLVDAVCAFCFVFF